VVGVEIQDGEVVVRMTGWERVWSLRREVRVPLAAVSGARAAPDLAGTRPRGLRWPGLSWPFRPGPAYAGTFRRGPDDRAFWCVLGAPSRRIMELTVSPGEGNGPFRRLVVQTDDPAVVARLVRSAASAARR
jgi:hypothetical protein